MTTRIGSKSPGEERRYYATPEANLISSVEESAH